MKLTTGWLKIACIINHSMLSDVDKTCAGYESAVNFMLLDHNLKSVCKQHISRLLSEAVNGKTKETNFKSYLTKVGKTFEPILLS